MQISESFLRSMRIEISRRLEHECFFIEVSRLENSKLLGYKSNTEVDYEEILRQLMVVHFRKISEKTAGLHIFSEVYVCLEEIFIVSKTDDLRYFDAWNNIFEVSQQFENFPRDMKDKLIIRYRELLLHYLNMAVQ